MKNFSPVVLGVFALCAMGLWGCSQQKAGAINAKMRDLESRYAKLEEDFRTLYAAHEQDRAKLAQAEEQRSTAEAQKADLTAKLDSVIHERENFRKQITQRTQERDHAQTNLIQFHQDLKTLAGRIEAALNSNPPNTGATIIPASRRTQ